MSGQISINDNNSPPDVNSILDINSNSKGILLPRMTRSEREMINAPADGLLVYQTDATNGFYIYKGNSWISINKKSSSTPVGAIIDWWRPDSSFPIPEGYVICDGSVINDSKSTLNGQTTPDLTDRYVVGTTSDQMAGTLGGQSSHNHEFILSNQTSSTNGSHTHSFNYGTLNTSTTGQHNHRFDFSSPTATTTFDGGHSHFWSSFDYNDKKWFTYNSNGQQISLFDWGNGIGSAGTGHFPIQYEGSSSSSFSTDYENTHNHQVTFPTNSSSSFTGSHSHSVNLGNRITSSAGAHNHAFDFGTTISTDASNDPKSYGLLKLMRIY